VVADHAARVLAGGAGLRAETRRMARVLQRQPLERRDPPMTSLAFFGTTFTA
jgi:hypothetical protein